MSGSANQPNEHRVVGARLREARLSMGLTQADVAQALGLSRPTLAAVEKGTRKITGLEVRRLARLYQQDVAWLLGEEETDVAAGRAPHRATAKLNEVDREQVLRFAEFLAAQRRTDDGANVAGAGSHLQTHLQNAMHAAVREHVRAAMRPGVGKALAKVLRGLAADFTDEQDYSGGDFVSDALALADAILGGAS